MVTHSALTKFFRARRSDAIGLLIVLLGFALRLALLQVFPVIPIRLDARAYYEQAQLLVEQGLAGWAFATRAPLYMLFMAGNFGVSGSDSPTFVRLIQILLSTATIALVYALTRLALRDVPRVWRNATALLAAALLALYPDYVFFAQLLWSETVFVFVTALAFYALLYSFRSAAPGRGLLLAGALFGLAALTREMILLFAIAFVPLWLWLRAAPWCSRIRWVGIFLAGVLLMILPWTLRNYARYNQFILISTQPSRDFWGYNAIFFLPHEPGRATPLKTLRDLVEDEQPGFKEGLALIASHPVEWVLTKTKEVSGIWSETTSNVIIYGWTLELISANTIPPLDAAFRVVWMLVIVFTTIGLFQARASSARQLFLLFLVACMMVFFATHYMPRFRLSLLAYFLPYTAYGVVETPTLLRNFVRTGRMQDRKRLALTIATLLLLSFTYPGELLNLIR